MYVGDVGRLVGCARRVCSCADAMARSLYCYRSAATRSAGCDQRRSLRRRRTMGRAERCARADAWPRTRRSAAYGMQMFCLRREQGRLREALPMLQHFVRDTPECSDSGNPGSRLIYAELDMRDACRAEFDRLPWDRAGLRRAIAGRMTVVDLRRRGLRLPRRCSSSGASVRVAAALSRRHEPAGRLRAGRAWARSIGCSAA